VAVVALGSNLGDREGHLRFAIDSLPGVERLSQVFETDPVGGPEGQPPYLNMVVQLRTELDPHALLRRCQEIEAAALRDRTIHWGPRTLDIDLLFYDDLVIRDEELTLPHPRLGERRFVLEPLAEVDSSRLPPGWRESVPAGGVHPRGPLGPGAGAR
jgi:2-amino-4-hydroxy-6-hydroxymethyldihydropteridine diphosphokinase